jgi:nicotinamide-nucleotide amidase
LVAERIEQWENNLPNFIKLAYLPSPGRVRLRLTARGINKEILENAISENVIALEKIISDIIVGYDDTETIEVVLGKKLSKLQKTIATAESCTGGKIASVISSVAGSSAYFKGSIVAYGTDIKENVLQIDNQIIEKHSVVSAEVAKAMAKSVQNICKTDFAIATTGNAGPQKGDSNAEIGTVFIALATPNQTFVEEFNFGQPREKVIDRAVNKSLEMLLKEI